MREWIFERPDEFVHDATHDEYCKAELIRCKDCKFKGEINCPMYHMDRILNPDDYCSFGERR